MLVIIDSFSKTMELIPCEAETSECIAKHFFREWCCRYGVPSQIVTDRHPSFTGAMLSHLAKYLGVKKSLICTQHPMANGLVERMNSSIMNSIRALIGDHPYTWRDLLPAIRFSYMSSVSSGSGYSPFELCFGCPARMSEQCLVKPPAEVPKKTQNLMTQLLPELSLLRECAKQNLERSAQVYKRKYDARQRTGVTGFKIGDLVLLKNARQTGQSSNKLTPKYDGPFQVLNRIGMVLYQIMEVKTYKTLPSPIHQDRLRPYVSPNTSYLRDLEEFPPQSPGPDRPPQFPIPITTGVGETQEIKMGIHRSKVSNPLRKRKGRLNTMYITEGRLI